MANPIHVMVVVSMATTTGAAGNNEIEFNRDVLPILTNNCFKCHGPDSKARQAGLRLDSLDGALALRDGIAAVVPGDTSASEMISRITADPDRRMPPVDSNLQLSASEIELLRRWIDQGAPWETHWSFVPPGKPERPTVVDETWPRTDIDHFVLSRIEAAGLTPNPPADRRALIRRVTLDLTGLPPTPSEVEAFVNDEDPGAYDQLVDRLLESPRFGEHMARPWLDLARYADSQGFEKDNPRTMWRYRDWVINALNADMPFDTFTREQLAGDLLESPTLQQLIATGFHRNTQTNTEGGTDNEEFRSAAVIDRVNTTMQGWMGLTMGCAQCHAHKYDPIQHDEYYSLYAFFNQTEDADLDDDAPFIKAPTTAQQTEMDALEHALLALDTRLSTPDEEVQAAVTRWANSRSEPTTWSTPEPSSLTTESGATLASDEEGVIHASGDVPLTDTYVLDLRTVLPRVTALRLDAIEGADGRGPGRTGHGNFVVNEIEIQSTREDALPVDFEGAEATFEQVDYSAAEAVDGDASTLSGWAIAPIYDKDQSAVFRFREPLELDDGEQLRVTIRQTHGTQHVLEHFRLSVTDQPKASLPPPDQITTILAHPEEQRDPSQKELLARHVLERSPALATLHDDLEKAREARDMFTKDVPSALVLRELPSDKQRTTRLFLGGSFLSPDTERGPIEPGVPGMLHEFPPDAPRNRLGLARWLVHPDNPLTARVQVNRTWSLFFGTGLVSTVDDFGVQGRRPSHPELLDWLATYWVNDLEWSPKALVRLLVTSAVYRQDATVSEAMLRIDPGNILLSRAPRLRLTAEQLRDQALFSAGLLVSDRIGGASVLPHLPDGMLPQAFTSLVLKASTGDDLYRRGLYTTWRRTGHYPSFATFDAPSREFCTIERERSNTPLQALILLNDTVFIEAAQGMARRTIEEEHDNIDGRITLVFNHALARPPTDEERVILLELYEMALAEAQGDPEQAHTLATVPRGPLPDTIRPEDAAAMTAVCNVVFNLDEYLNRP